MIRFKVQEFNSRVRCNSSFSRTNLQKQEHYKTNSLTVRLQSQKLASTIYGAMVILWMATITKPSWANIETPWRFLQLSTSKMSLVTIKFTLILSMISLQIFRKIWYSCSIRVRFYFIMVSWTSSLTPQVLLCMSVRCIKLDQQPKPWSHWELEETG
jgi:hypothetical protein